MTRLKKRKCKRNCENIDDTFIPDVHVRVAIIRLLGPHADTVVLLLDDAEGAADVVVVLAEGFADQRQQLKRVRRRKGRWLAPNKVWSVLCILNLTNSIQ